MTPARFSQVYKIFHTTLCDLLYYRLSIYPDADIYYIVLCTCVRLHDDIRTVFTKHIQA